MKKGTLAFVVAKKVLWIFVRALTATLRVHRVNDAALQDAMQSGRNVIIAFWHGEMLAGWYAHRPKKGARVTALISQSGDGELLAATLEHMGYTVVRGSSHRGGKEAMQLMEEAIGSGSSLCITPDGPTGPPHVMKMGAVRLSQKTGTPLFLAGIAVGKKKNLKSWDSFTIPMPFSRVSICYSNPVQPVDGESLEDVRAKAEESFAALIRSAEQRVSEQ